MNKKLIITAVLSLAALLVPAAAYAQAPSPAVISSLTVQNLDGSDVTNGPLMAGATYTVTFDIDVGVGVSDTSLKLSTPLQKIGDVYWRLENEYAGINTDTWQPGLATIAFTGAEGKASFTLRGTVPTDYTSEKISNDDYLHFVKPLPIVSLLLGQNDAVVDDYPVSVKDQAIVAYEEALSKKESLLDSTSTISEYAQLAKAVLLQAKSLNEKGYVENAKKLLDTLPPSKSDFPISSAEANSFPFFIGLAALVLLLVAVTILLLRAKADSNLVRQQVDEEAGKLDVLSVRLSKMDRQLGQDVDQVRESLQRISGR